MCYCDKADTEQRVWDDKATKADTGQRHWNQHWTDTETKSDTEQRQWDKYSADTETKLTQSKCPPGHFASIIFVDRNLSGSRFLFMT